MTPAQTATTKLDELRAAALAVTGEGVDMTPNEREDAMLELARLFLDFDAAMCRRGAALPEEWLEENK